MISNYEEMIEGQKIIKVFNHEPVVQEEFAKISEEKQVEAARQFELKQQKKKEKHRGR